MDAALDRSGAPEAAGRDPGGPSRRYEARFPARQQSVLAVRRFAATQLGALPRVVADAVAVVVSELACNAVQHAATEFVVRIDFEPRRIHVEVEDMGDGCPEVRSPAEDEDRGRGLQIVSGLSAEWGVAYPPSGRGKTVWTTLRCAGGVSPGSALPVARAPLVLLATGGGSGGHPGAGARRWARSPATRRRGASAP